MAAQPLRTEGTRPPDLGGSFSRRWLSRAAFVVVTTIALFVPRNGVAQPKKPAAPAAPAPTNPAPTNPPPAPAAPRPSRASVARVAESLAADLAPAPFRALVVAAPLVSDTPAPRGVELTARMASLLAGRLGAGSSAHPTPLSLADARVAARGERSFVHLVVEIHGGKIRVTADVFPVPRTVWARIRDPEPGPLAHAFAEAPLDAEIRSFLERVPLAKANVTRGQNFESDVVALACGDLDGDGALEILSTSRRRVTTLRLRDGKVLPLRSRSWSDLSPLHPSPLREPIGLAGLVERKDEAGGVAWFADVGVTDRAKALRLDAELAVVAPLAGLPVSSSEASGCARVASGWLTGPLVPCLPGETTITPAAIGSFDVLAAASLVTPRGQRFTVLAARNDRGVVEVRDDAGHVETITGAGAQLAVGDLDQDGDPEILSGLDVANALDDAVVVRTWARAAAGEAGRPREILRLPAAAGVRALAVCPPDGPGRAPFVVATADEIWVVR
ncbi:hypothetical protein [Polyangium sp. y55x31]|uniref:hypothetical protein n=1 Tax=Polyangium sp. y55x31 TaxID=3042688 RepID=UPI0024828676|nr:hypothetical protein [Polyangium sp. y55x31]MDI1482104.1 hypothetical protein [Polyangium sp. y55x31]